MCLKEESSPVLELIVQYNQRNIPGLRNWSSVSTSPRVTDKNWYLGLCQHHNLFFLVTRLRSCNLSESFKFDTVIRLPPASTSLRKFLVALANILRAPDYLKKNIQEVVISWLFSKITLFLPSINQYTWKNTFSLEKPLVWVQLMSKKSNWNTEREYVYKSG